MDTGDRYLTGDPFGNLSEPPESANRLDSNRLGFEFVWRKVVLQKERGDPLQYPWRRGTDQAFGDEAFERTCFSDQGRFARSQIVQAPVGEMGD